MDKIRGKVFILDENVDTDQILPGYAMSYPVEELREATLRGSIIPDFPERVKPGDIIIADENFGCGSSREQAPVALKSSGVGIVISKSFARIFRKNAINIGLPVITCDCIDEIKKDCKEHDKFEVDIVEGTLLNTRINKAYKLDKLSQTTLDTLQAGGLINKIINILEERSVI